MAKDYQQLREKMTVATERAESVRTLAEILADEGGRDFTSRSAQDDGGLCVEILDHGLSACNLNRVEEQAFFTAPWALAEIYGRLPDSMMLKDKLEVSNEIHASGPFSDIRAGTYNGTKVAVKTLRVSRRDDPNNIRKAFFKQVILWSSLSHPNVLELVGVLWDMNRAQFTTVSKWMACGNIMDYIKHNAVNRLELLHGAAQGLKHLHDAGIAHGDLKGANILITSEAPQRACLADSSFMTPQSLALAGIITPESDIYSFGMVILQVLTGEMPFRDIQTPQLGHLVLNGMRPRKPENAKAIGFSDPLWDLVHLCWDGDSKRRPKIAEVVTRLDEASTNWHTPMPATAMLEPEGKSDSESIDYYGIFQPVTPSPSETPSIQYNDSPLGVPTIGSPSVYDQSRAPSIYAPWEGSLVETPTSLSRTRLKPPVGSDQRVSVASLYDSGKYHPTFTTNILRQFRNARRTVFAAVKSVGFPNRRRGGGTKPAEDKSNARDRRRNPLLRIFGRCNCPP